MTYPVYHEMPERPSRMRNALAYDQPLLSKDKHIGDTYGTIPRVATADGRDRIPSEMFSATITAFSVRKGDSNGGNLGTLWVLTHSSLPA
jgi:hypothetical protein